MVRSYQRKVGTRTYKSYTEEKLEEVLKKIADQEISMKAASVKYKIAYGTLYNKYHGRHIRKAGGQSVFTEAEEMALISSAMKCADWGFPLDILDLRMLAKGYLDKSGRIVTKFPNNIPGKDWAIGLLKRYNNTATQRLASNISKARAGVSRETLEMYFRNLEATMKNIPASNIFNYDETNVGDDPGKRRAIYRRGVKYPEKIINHSKSCTTIMICGSADGTLLPPYVIYRSEHLYNTWKQGGIHGEPCCSKPCCSRGCRFNRTSHGWIDSSTFQDWFETCFLPHAKRLVGQKVLIGDNLASHFNGSVIKLCEENDISFVCLVPNSTHICQPLDVAFFKPFKVSWRAVITTYKLKNKVPGIPKEVFPSLLKLAIERMDGCAAQTNHKPGDNQVSAIKRNLINGFYASGIYPLNKHKVLEKIPDTTKNPNTEINDTLTELLKEKRFGHTTETIRRKKKRLNVEPGKSIATANNSSSSEEEEEEVVSQLFCEDETDDSFNEEQEVEYTKPEKILLLPGVFVLVKFLSGKRRSITYKYVCRIVEEEDYDEFTIEGFKSVNKELTTFRLVPKDISTVAFADILAILPVPNEENNNFNFVNRVDVCEL